MTVKNFYSILFFTAMACASFSTLAERVECPMGTQWKFEGYCSKEIDPGKADKCPQGSKMTRKYVTGPMLCVADGKCSGSRVPSAVGVCNDPPEIKKPAYLTAKNN